jgi:transposase
LSYEELEQLLAARDAEIVELKARRDVEVAVLKMQVVDLEARLAKLEHLLTRNSGNSSMPPSRDNDPGKPTPDAKPKVAAGKRKKGKQKGAPGANLAWRDRPDDTVNKFPEGTCECGHDLADATDLGIVDRYQQHEIPATSATVTQYDQHAARSGTDRTCRL